jgi:hypothetical protein
MAIPMVVPLGLFGFSASFKGNMENNQVPICRRNTTDSLPRGMPVVVDESIEVRKRRIKGDTECDVGRFGPSA